jgi:hypothetical protein
LEASATRVAFKAGGVERVLLLGAAPVGGVFAQLVGTPAVFVVPTRVVETVSAGLVAKTALATPLAQIDSLRVVALGKVFAAERQGARFVVLDSAEQASATAAVERVARLRAETVVHYGPPLPSEGFAHPRATITVTGGAPTTTTHTVTFGAAVGESEPAQVYARRSDLDATFTVLSATYDRLSELATKSP